MKRTYLTIPNLLTYSRLLGLPFLYLFVILDYDIAFLIGFILIGSTDAFDGYLARKLNQVSDHGKMMDSIADVFFYVSSAYFYHALFPQYLEPNNVLLITFFSIFALSFIISGILLKKPIMMHTSLLRYNAINLYLLVIVSFFLNATVYVAITLIIYIIAFIEEIGIFIFYGQVDPDTKTIFSLRK